MTMGVMAWSSWRGMTHCNNKMQYFLDTVNKRKLIWYFEPRNNFPKIDSGRIYEVVEETFRTLA
jgi:hypothetical protein